MVALPHPPARSVLGESECAMTFQQRKPAGKEPEKQKGNAPDYVVRARQEPGSDFFVNCGAAWMIEVNGKPAISLKLTAMPINTDGSFLLLPPKED